MNRFIDYQSFPELEQASGLIEILDSNNIPYEIDDSAARFNLVASTNSPLNQVIVRIREIDIDKANLLQADNSDIKIEDHYLYTFSDKDIIDVIANPIDWSAEEYAIAQKIFKQRNLKASAEEIKAARKQSMSEKISQVIEIEKFYKGISIWFYIIAVFSIINSIVLALNWKVNFPVGLGITQIIDSLFIKLFGQYVIVSGFITLVISGVFILFGYYSKKKSHSAIIVGMLVYGLDTVIIFLLKYWIGFGFHLFILFGLISGFERILKEKKKNIA